MSEASSSVNEQESARRAELETKIRKRVACEERAFRIVEKLLETTVSSEYLTDCAHYITPSHYADIVEERAIVHLCGYPVCGKPLGKVPQQKYYISTKSNTVYDITERKNFCSNKCFKASKYLEKQISTTPVWLRETEKPPDLKVLHPDENVGSPGHEVVGRTARSTLVNQVSALQVLDQADDGASTMDSTTTSGPCATTTPPAVKSSKVDSKTSVLSVKSTTETETSRPLSEDLTLRNQTESSEPLSSAATKPVVNETAEFESVTASLSEKLNIHPVSPTPDHMSEKLCSEPRSVSKERYNNSTEHGETPPDSGSSKMVSNLDSSETELQTRSSNTASNLDSSKTCPDSGSSKTEYLMKLLNKRKHLLSAMIDDQPLQSFEKNSSMVTMATERQPIKVEQNLTVKEKNVDANFKSKKNLVVQENAVEHVPQTVKTGSDCDKISELSTEYDKEFRKHFPKVSPQLAHICFRISEWVSEETVQYLGLGNTSKQNISSCASVTKERLETVAGSTDKSEGKNVKYQSADDAPVSENQTENTTPAGAPTDFQILREKNEEFAMKVREFYKGTAKRVSTPRDKVLAGDDDISGQPVLPPVDSIAQMRIRRKIVLEKLERSIPEMLVPLGLAIQHMSAELRELVNTFSLTSTNITFKPGEWTFVALILIKMLSQKVSLIQKRFEEGRSLQFYQVFLASLGLSMSDLDKLLNIILIPKSG